MAAVLVLVDVSAASAASVTIGEIASGVPPSSVGCPAGEDWDVFEPPGSVPGVSYAVPAGDGLITSWSTSAAAGSGQSLQLNVYRQVSGNTYEVVAHDGPHALAPGQVNTFSTDLAVAPGDIIGLGSPSSNTSETACATASASSSDLELQQDLGDGQSATFTNFNGYKDNVSAVVQPNSAGTAYVTDNGDGGGSTVTPINTATNTAGAPITVGGAPAGIAITPDARTAYVTNNADGTVTPIVVSTNTAGSPISVGSHPSGIAITPDGKTAYVTNSGDGTVTPITLATGHAGTAITVGSSPRSIAITPDGKTAYVSNINDGNVTPINTATNAAGTPITVGVANYGLAVTPDGKTLYIPVWGSMSGFGTGTTVVPVDTATDHAGTAIPDGGTGPITAAITPDGKTVYVANDNSDNVTPIDTASNHAGTPISAGSGPNGVAVTPDGKTVYATDNSSGNGNRVTPIDTGTSSAEASIVVGGGADYVAITPDESPAASFSFTGAHAGGATTFNGSASTASAGRSVARYDWSFGDGDTAPNGGPHPAHVYASPGRYTATLTVTDDAGCSSAIIFTGQTASCGGGPSARRSITITVSGGQTGPSCTLVPAGKRVFAATISDAKHKKPRTGVLRVVAKCNQSASLTLTGKVTAVVKKAVAKAAKGKRKKSKTFKLSAVHASATAGKSLTLSVKLPKAVLALLKRGARESVSFTLAASNSNGTGHASAKIKRLKLAKSKHK